MSYVYHFRFGSWSSFETEFEEYHPLNSIEAMKRANAFFKETLPSWSTKGPGVWVDTDPKNRGGSGCATKIFNFVRTYGR